MALYHSSRTVVIGVLGIGIVIVGVTCVSTPLFHVNHSELIVRACKWTLVAGGGSTFVPTSAPGCHYILSERSYVHHHDTTLSQNLLTPYITGLSVRFMFSALPFNFFKRLPVPRSRCRMGGIGTVRRIGLLSDVDENL
jgi:hypothetical protein